MNAKEAFKQILPEMKTGDTDGQKIEFVVYFDEDKYSVFVSLDYHVEWGKQDRDTGDYEDAVESYTVNHIQIWDEVNEEIVGDVWAEELATLITKFYTI